MTAAYAEPSYATDLTAAPTSPSVALVGQVPVSYTHLRAHET